MGNHTAIQGQSKPQVEIASIGHEDGSHLLQFEAVRKTLLLHRRANGVLSEPRSPQWEHVEKQVRKNTLSLAYETAHRRYIHHFFSDDASCPRYMILAPQFQPSGVVLLVNARAAVKPPPQQAFLSLLRRLYSPTPLLFLDYEEGVTENERESSRDSARRGLRPPEWNGRLETHLRAQLTYCGFQRDTVPVMQADLLAISTASDSPAAPASAAFPPFFEVLDALVPLPQADHEKPLLMTLEEGISQTHERRLVVTGTVARGRLWREASVEILGPDGIMSGAVVTDFVPFHHEREWVGVGERIGCLLERVTRQPMMIGHRYILFTPGSMRVRRSFKAAVYALTTAEAGFLGVR